MPKIRTFYDASVSVPWKFHGESKTDRSFTESHDIKKLVEKVFTGEVSPVSLQGAYMDSTIDDEFVYNVVAERDRIFASLPSNVREHYGNDPLNLRQILEEHPELFASKKEDKKEDKKEELKQGTNNGTLLKNEQKGAEKTNNE